MLTFYGSYNNQIIKHGCFFKYPYNICLASVCPWRNHLISTDKIWVSQDLKMEEFVDSLPIVQGSFRHHWAVSQECYSKYIIVVKKIAVMAEYDMSKEFLER